MVVEANDVLVSAVDVPNSSLVDVDADELTCGSVVSGAWASEDTLEARARRQ